MVADAFDDPLWREFIQKKAAQYAALDASKNGEK